MAQDRDLLKALVKEALDQILQAEMTDFLGAAPGERTATRAGYRAGYYERGLITRVGKIELRVPRDRSGEFSTALFERFQRSEKALVSALVIGRKCLSDRGKSNKSEIVSADSGGAVSGHDPFVLFRIGKSMKAEYSIAHYRVGHFVIPDENRLVPDAAIVCYSKSDVDPVAVLHFFKVTDEKRSSPLGIFLESGGRIRMTLRLDRYAQIIDLLRHESPVRVWADNDNDGLVYGGLYTAAKEPVGEGDVDHTPDWLTDLLSAEVRR